MKKETVWHRMMSRILNFLAGLGMLAKVEVFCLQESTWSRLDHQWRYNRMAHICVCQACLWKKWQLPGVAVDTFKREQVSRGFSQYSLSLALHVGEYLLWSIPMHFLPDLWAYYSKFLCPLKAVPKPGSITFHTTMSLLTYYKTNYRQNKNKRCVRK